MKTMPHKRERYATSRIKKILSYSPIVGILGQRQVGKTTLLESACREYVTFDKEAFLLQAQSDPEVFIQNRTKPFGIDEAQLSPRLFPALKEWVRTHQSPGQFILSGSVRFTSRKAIRESLTGRIINTEILPFTLAEAHQQPLPQTLRRLANAKTEKDLISWVDSLKNRNPSEFEKYLMTGGLPGICFFRESHVRRDKFEAHLDTLLNRDLRLVYETTLPSYTLKAFLTFLSKNQGRPFDWKKASDASQISVVTLKKVVYAFEALFLIRAVESIGPEKKGSYFLEDQGIATWLSGTAFADPFDIVRGIYANLRQEFHYHPELEGKISQYRTKHGVSVPLVFQCKDFMIGVICSMERELPPKTIASATSFLKRFPKAKAVVAYGGSEVIAKSNHHYWVPYQYLT